MDKSPCYGCTKASICPYKETFQKLCANTDKLKINKEDIDSTPIDTYMIRVEHRYADGPGLEQNLSALGVKPTNRHCTLNRACPMTPWWSDPIRDNGVPIGYPIDRVARDARDCNGEKIPYRPRHTMEKTNIITRNDKDLPFRVNCFSCIYRETEMSSQLEELIQSCASTFRVDYVQVVKGSKPTTALVALTTLNNYEVDYSRTPEQWTIKSERDVITIYYKYKDPANDSDAGVASVPTVEHLKEDGHGISLSLLPIQIYGRKGRVVNGYYCNLSGTVGPLVDMRNNFGLMQKPGDKFGISEPGVMYDKVTTEAFLETDNIEFDIVIDEILYQADGANGATRWRVPRHVIAAIIPNGIFNITESQKIEHRADGVHAMSIFHVEIEYFKKKVLEITPFVIPENKSLTVNYHMRETAVTAARWARKSGKPFIPRYFGYETSGKVIPADEANKKFNMVELPPPGEKFHVIELPSPGDLYRPGFRLVGYTTDIEKRLKADNGPALLFESEAYPDGLKSVQIALHNGYEGELIDSDGLSNIGNQLFVYYTDVPKNRIDIDHFGLETAEYAALWDLDKNFFEDNLLKAIKTQFPDYAPPVVVDEAYSSIRLTGKVGTDGANAMYNMLRKFKLDMDDMGFQVEIYCAPELADPDAVTIVDHRDNPENKTPVLMVSRETSPGVMEDVQLYPLNLDNFEEKLKLGTYHYHLVIYPEDMDGVYGDTSWVDRGIDLTIVPLDVDVLNYITPKEDVDDPNVVPFFSKIEGLMPEDIDNVSFNYATESLEGINSENYHVAHVDTRKRWSVMANIGFKSIPGFMAETPLFTQRFTSFCRHMDTCEVTGQILKGMKIGEIFVNGTPWSEMTDDSYRLKFDDETGEFTITVFDVRGDIDIDIAIIPFDADANDPNTCPTCRNLINLSDYPWIDVKFFCRYYSV